MKWPKYSLDRLLFQLGAGLLGLMLLVTAIRLPFLPEQIPSHYNFAGQADSYAGKWVALAMPAIALVCFVTMEFFVRHCPDRLNIPVKIKPEKEAESFAIAGLMTRMVNVEVMLLCLLIQCATVFLRPQLVGGVWIVVALMCVTIVAGCVQIWKINR